MKKIALLIVICLPFFLEAQDLNTMKVTNLSNGEVIDFKSTLKTGPNVIVFTSTECPFDKYYSERIMELSRDYSAFNWILVNSNSTETDVIKLKKWVIEEELEMRYLVDGTANISKYFKARKSAHVVVFNYNNQKIQFLYEGAIDNNPQDPDNVNHAYLREALKQVTEGDMKKLPSQLTMGCMIR